jgi:DNA-binding PucR family transcriptional regulator
VTTSGGWCCWCQRPTRSWSVASSPTRWPAPAAGRRSAADPDRLPEAYAEARRCLDTLVTLGRQGEVSDPAGLGLTRLLLGENGPEELAAFLETTLGPLLRYDAQRGTSLVETVEAWFGCGGRLKETGAALHVHPNTVSQRLDRVAGLLGDDWRDPARALDLQLALRVHRLCG